MRFPVFIGLRRSKLLAGALCAMHGAAACVFLRMPWPPPARIGLLAILAVSLWRALRPPRVTALRLRENGALECLLPDGTDRPAHPLPDTAVFPCLVVLRLEIEGEKGTLSLPLFPDHMPREEFRLLRLWLRWNAGEKP
ncbi:MAG: hypothetical protein LBI87_12025 [Candidatus Accumulibacter sp.]|nr:hypothetical protein [Accumulibacter sp.]